MSSASFDLVLLWTPAQSDADYSELRKVLETSYPKEFLVHPFTKTDEAIKFVQSRTKSSRPLVVITKLGANKENLGQQLIETIRPHDKRTFIILHSHTACADPNHRWYFAELGVNMITVSLPDIRHVFDQILTLGESHPKSTYTCPYCQWPSLSASQLYVHMPLYHTNSTSLSAKCEICEQPARNIGVHMHDEHMQETQQGPDATPLYAYSLVVCQRKRDQRFLVVQEAGSMGFWLPGGRVEVGEQLDVAAVRETLEEAGVKVRLTGVLKFEFTPRSHINRLRVIFFAEPCDENDCEAKTIPDYESYGAVWLTYEQVVECAKRDQLRGNEPLKWFKYITQNGVVHPMSILSKSEI